MVHTDLVWIVELFDECLQCVSSVQGAGIQL
jgi:hypothetical protein